ncbi:MAG: hypothetical protein PHT78_12560 [Desulfitobacteriaceae bacterium]|nr:hypothetical protein [Desulfotomaculaceae bacterium]MDD4754051.1 hypothetical protein [Desulfitobacteriaceae bacterium]
MIARNVSLRDYFIRINFYDLLPLAIEIATDLGYGQDEMIEAVCKTYDKFLRYPPSRNRTAWFKTVLWKKLLEARSDILAFRAMAR